MKPKRRCMYSRVYHEETLLIIGCKVHCEKVNIVCTLYINFSHLLLHIHKRQELSGVQKGKNVYKYKSFSLYSQERKCCAGYYGVNCEKCPGSEGQPCFGNGVCVDGINGTGVCQCNQGFNGTACESCQAGKYGIHCDQGIVLMLKAHTCTYCVLCEQLSHAIYTV